MRPLIPKREYLLSKTSSRYWLFGDIRRTFRDGKESGNFERLDAMSKSRVGAVILAAGRSTRMGEAKQLLRLGESTVLGQTLDNLGGAGVDEIVLVLGF